MHTTNSTVKISPTGLQEILVLNNILVLLFLTLKDYQTLSEREIKVFFKIKMIYFKICRSPHVKCSPCRGRFQNRSSLGHGIQIWKT